jgi:phosphate transport system substrate-binding protein
MRCLPGAALLGLALLGCGVGERGADDALQGVIEIDGSSTVFPVSEAVAEEFMMAKGRGVHVTVGVSGTGGGFKRFCAGEIALGNASRPMKESERERCAQNGIEYLELPVAYDGISLVVHHDNTVMQCVTTEELRRLWAPESKVQRWSDLRPEWPAQPIRLYGPGPNNGTFDYFTEAVVGKEGAVRADYTASADANVLAQGVSGDPASLGYFGFAYYEQNAARLKLVGIDAGEGCVQPSLETIKDGSYKPLSRPLFIYLSKKALERPEVAAFAQFYMESAGELATGVGYVPLEAERYQESLATLTQVTGGASH